MDRSDDAEAPDASRQPRAIFSSLVMRPKDPPAEERRDPGQAAQQTESDSADATLAHPVQKRGDKMVRSASEGGATGAIGGGELAWTIVPKRQRRHHRPVGGSTTRQILVPRYRLIPAPYYSESDSGGVGCYSGNGNGSDGGQAGINATHIAHHDNDAEDVEEAVMRHLARTPRRSARQRRQLRRHHAAGSGGGLASATVLAPSLGFPGLGLPAFVTDALPSAAASTTHVGRVCMHHRTSSGRIGKPRRLPPPLLLPRTPMSDFASSCGNIHVDGGGASLSASGRRLVRHRWSGSDPGPSVASNGPQPLLLLSGTVPARSSIMRPAPSPQTVCMAIAAIPGLFLSGLFPGLGRAWDAITDDEEGEAASVRDSIAQLCRVLGHAGVVKRCGRSLVRRRVPRLLILVLTFPLLAHHGRGAFERGCGYTPGDEGRPEFWTRFAETFGNWLGLGGNWDGAGTSTADAFDGGVVLYRLVLLLSTARQRFLEQQEQKEHQKMVPPPRPAEAQHVQSVGDAVEKDDCDDDDDEIEDNNDSDEMMTDGVSVLTRRHQQPSQLQRRVSVAVDAWLLFLERSRGGNLDPEMLADLRLE